MEVCIIHIDTIYMCVYVCIYHHMQLTHGCQKNKLYRKYLGASGKDQESSLKAFRSAKSSLQGSIRKMKNQWWLSISEETQKAYDMKDAKTLYHLFRQVFGPQSSSVVPLRSKDELPPSIRVLWVIMTQWTEHFTDLFYNPSVTDDKCHQ